MPGTSKNDVYYGSAGNDIMYGLAGADRLFGQGGNDTLDGGAGIDQLTGGAGADLFRFASLTDSTRLAGAMDRITDFTRGQDKFDLSATGISGIGQLKMSYDAYYKQTYVFDTKSNFGFYLSGNHANLSNADFILAGNAKIIQGTSASENLIGTSASEILRGLDGNDALFGSGGNDTLEGGNGVDTLTGGQGRDALFGGNGVDFLNGDGFALFGSRDTLTGGAGADYFTFGSETIGIADTVKDFKAAEGDHIVLDLAMTDFGWDDFYTIDDLVAADRVGNNTVLYVNTNAGYDNIWEPAYYLPVAVLEGVTDFNVLHMWWTGQLDVIFGQ